MNPKHKRAGCVKGKVEQEVSRVECLRSFREAKVEIWLQTSETLQSSTARGIELFFHFSLDL